MEVTKTDLIRATVVLTALRRGKYDMQGDEVLAFAQAFTWLTELHDRVKLSLEPPAAPAPVAPPPTPIKKRGRPKKAEEPAA